MQFFSSVPFLNKKGTVEWWKQMCRRMCRLIRTGHGGRAWDVVVGWRRSVPKRLCPDRDRQAGLGGDWEVDSLCDVLFQFHHIEAIQHIKKQRHS